MNSFTQDCSRRSETIRLTTSPIDRAELLLGCAILKRRIANGPAILALIVAFDPNSELLDAIAKMTTLSDLRFYTKMCTFSCLKTLPAVTHFSFSVCRCGILHEETVEVIRKVTHLYIRGVNGGIFKQIACGFELHETLHVCGVATIPDEFYEAVATSPILRVLTIDERIPLDGKKFKSPPTLTTLYANVWSSVEDFDTLCDRLPVGFERMHIVAQVGMGLVRLIQRCEKLVTIWVSRPYDSDVSVKRNVNNYIIDALELYGADIERFVIYHYDVEYSIAIERAKEFNRIAAFACAIGRKGTASIFLQGDGDNALMTRVTQFLV